MVNAVPNNLVIQPCRDTPPHCKDQFAIESFFQQFEDLPPLSSVRQIGGSARTRVAFAISLSGIKLVADNNGARRVAITLQVLVDSVGHVAWRLVAHHVTEDSGADGTFGPVVLADELEQANLVVLVRAAQHEYIVVVLLGDFMFQRLDHELLETDHALLVLHFALGQLELESGEVGDLEDVVVLLLLSSVLLVYHGHHEGQELEIRVARVDCVLVIEVDFQRVLV